MSQYRKRESGPDQVTDRRESVASRVKVDGVRENGSARINTIEGIEFWLTPQNQIFLIESATGKQVYPIDGGEPVTLPAKVIVELKRLQQKQREIRRQWDEEDKDSPEAFTFSEEVGERPRGPGFRDVGVRTVRSGADTFSGEGQ